MSYLGKSDALLVKQKQLDAGLKCTWNWSWLKLKYNVEVKGEELKFSLSGAVKKINKKDHVRCVLWHKEINEIHFFFFLNVLYMYMS